jgi:tripartite-type tricarboxylate transporter receptor subunit TctC
MQALKEDSRNNRRTVADALEVIRQEFGVDETPGAEIRVGPLLLPSGEALRRASVAPDLPTISEAGLTGFDTSGWFGLLAPAGTAREVIDRVAAASNEAAKSPDVVATLARQGFDMAGGSPEEFAVFIRDDLAKWERVAGAAGLKR